MPQRADGPPQRAQSLPPVDVRRVGATGRAQFQIQQVDQAVEQGVLATDVRIQRHRRQPDPLRHRAHGHGREAVFVDQRQGLVENQPSLVVHRITVSVRASAAHRDAPGSHPAG
jgi:hypothetical protein